MSDFAKAVLESQTRPPGMDSVAFDPFAPPAPEAPPLVTTATGEGAFPGATKWDMVYRCRRFYMGREVQEVLEGGAKLYADRDESEEYEGVMKLVVAGEALVVQRSQTILGDGSVVIWLEWTERKAPPPQPPRAEREHLTLDELMTPERVTKRSEALDAEAAEAAPEPTTNDEPDW